MNNIDTNHTFILFNELPLMILVIDEDYNIAFWNKHLEAVTKIKSQEKIGKNLLEEYPRLQNIIFKSRIDSVLCGGPPSTFSYLLHQYFIDVLIKDGEIQKQNAVVKYFLDSESRKKFATIILHDMTEVHSQSQKIKKIREEAFTELEISHDRLSNFAGTVAHDIKTPLGNIMSLSDILLDEVKEKKIMTEDDVEMLNMIVTSADRLNNLTTDLLTYSKAKNVNEPEQPVNLNELLQEIEQDLSTFISGSNASIVISNELPTVSGWGFLLRQLFQNIIVNSVKYKKENVDSIIKIESSLSGGMHVISLEDNGIGFTAEEAEKIFNPFQRLEGKHNVEGTGIGLATCERIIEQHKGSIKAIGEEGIGAKFIISIPKK